MLYINIYCKCILYCVFYTTFTLYYIVEGHPFAPLGIAVTSDNRYLVSVSNIVIIWDLSTGGIFKEIPTDKPIQVTKLYTIQC